MRAILIVFVSAVVLALGVYGVWTFLTPSESDPIPEPTPAAALDEDVTAPSAVDVDQKPVTPTTTRTVVPAAEPVTAPPTNVMPESFRKALSGIRGRLVEEDGTPVADVPVDLLQIHLPTLMGSHADLYDDAMLMVENPPKLEVDSTVTKEDGTFVLKDAEMRAFHGLGIDLGGARSSLRVLDVGLHEGQIKDIGDITLMPFVTFTGFVSDPEGNPVPNARVRATLLPPIVFQAGVTDIRADSALLLNEVMGNDMPMVLELPPWAMAYESKLPIPTTYTEEDGSFRLEGVPQGLVTVVADKAGFAGVFRSMPSGRSGERKFPTIMLSRGQTLAGRVVDAAGQAVRGAEVVGGVLMSIGFVGIAQRGRKTAADGSFAIPGIPDGPVYIAARRAAAHPWKVIGPVDRPGDAVIEMESTTTMRVTLADMDGNVVPEATIRVMPTSLAAEIPVMALRTPADYTSHVKKVEDGVYEIRDLPFGGYHLSGQAPGFGIATAEAPLTAEMLEHELRFPPGFNLTVRVLDEETREPIEWARVAVMKNERYGDMPMLNGRTNQDGLATLGPAPDQKPRELLVWANHPGYANHSVPVEDDPTKGTLEAPIEILLNGGGTLEGRVHYGGRPVDPPHWVILEPRDYTHPDNNLPRMAVTDAEGKFRFENLKAGDTRYEVYERFLFADPQQLIQKAVENFDPDSLVRGDVEIRVGENEFLDLNLDPTALGAPATIVGFIDSPADDSAEYTVHVYGEDSQSVETQAGQEFRIEELKPGRYWLNVQRVIKEGERSTRHSQVYQEQLELNPGEVHNMEVRLDFFEVAVEVVNIRTGTPVPDANVSMQLAEEEMWMSFGGNTNNDGVATIEIARSGRCHIEAKKDGIGVGNIEAEIPSDGLLSVALDPGVPCAGRIEFDESKLDPNADSIQLSFLQNTGDRSIRTVQNVSLQPHERHFEVFGLQPGEYHLWMWAGETRTNRWVSFQLPEGGDTNLVIRLNLR